ncbi:type I methionyl aminopeptidase [Proteiniclasticum sp. BAD-10]|uniref:Methionine aminopeptidase n=1 Tax=Proteiniclasticum sediminis TaxID=2804028 RepID=A0A941HRI7_9CLOT|nr:type I methionyl aminopeptidase [Proteiniclasticum sediminis]MBR0576282.1 type I methionyl aminopeptidase [Proteiniclasticum sediminis]
MINIKTAREIELMKNAGRLVGETLKLLESQIRPGISTLALDKIAEEFIMEHGAIPSFKNYNGFPGSICASVNHVVIHGIPSKAVILKEGDIISVDCGALLQGFHGDAARTFRVGQVSEEADRLIKITEESFFKGLEQAKVGQHLGDISAAIQKHIESNGFSVVRDFTGHGIGRDLHEAPSIPNYGTALRGPKLRAGMALAIEPMVNVGLYHVKVLEDNWTTVTRDGKLSAHYENTVIITEDGPLITTLL